MHIFDFDKKTTYNSFTLGMLVGLSFAPKHIFMDKYVKFALFLYILSLFVVNEGDYKVPILACALIFIIYQIMICQKEKFTYLKNPELKEDDMEQRNINFDKITPKQLNDKMIQEGNILIDVINDMKKEKLDDREISIVQELEIKAKTLITSGNNLNTFDHIENDAAKIYLRM